MFLYCLIINFFYFKTMVKMNYIKNTKNLKPKNDATTVTFTKFLI